MYILYAVQENNQNYVPKFSTVSNIINDARLAIYIIINLSSSINQIEVTNYRGSICPTAATPSTINYII